MNLREKIAREVEWSMEGHECRVDGLEAADGILALVRDALTSEQAVKAANEHCHYVDADFGGGWVIDEDDTVDAIRSAWQAITGDSHDTE